MNRLWNAIVGPKVEIKPEVKNGLERLFREDLREVLEKPPVYDYYETNGAHPNGSIYAEGDYKGRNAEDPYQMFVQHICEHIFLQDGRFDETTYPGADAPWRVLLNSETPAARAYFGEMEKASKDRGFKNTAKALRDLIQTEYKKVHGLIKKENLDHRHIEGAIESIVAILRDISRGEGERSPIILGSWAGKYPDKGTLRIVK